MSDRDLLMIPGPTNVAPSVLSALARPTVSHTSPSFINILKETLSGLKEIFQSRGLVLPLAGTGTLGDEIALTNVVEPQDEVLAICNGHFAERLAEVASTLGAKVDKVQIPWGSAADPAEVSRKLSSKRYKCLLTVHVDTSTGAANPIQSLGKVAKEHGALYVVDAVCSLGGMDVQVDNWNIDVCFTGSQKALGVPPGLAIICFGERALKAREERKTPMTSYYGDLKRWSPVMEEPTKYFATHPVNMIYALHDSCKMILSEGLEKRFARHASLASAFRRAMRAVNLQPLCEEQSSANTLTVVKYPNQVQDAKFRKTVSDKYGITIAGGLGPLSQKVFRVGHMGNVNRNDLFATIAAIEGALAEQGHSFTAGAGVSAGNHYLNEIS